MGGHWGRLPGGGDGKDACGRRWDLEFPRCPSPWPPQHLSFFTPGIYSTHTIQLLGFRGNMMVGIAIPAPLLFFFKKGCGLLSQIIFCRGWGERKSGSEDPLK